MRKVIYSMIVSLDGYIEDANGDFAWSVPDEELHRHFNDQERECGVHLYGRRLYEIMAGYWTTADTNPNLPAYILEYARLWKSVPNIIFSQTLTQVGENARLVRDNIAEEVAALKAQSGKDMALGGAGIAATFMRLGLIDEYQVYIVPMLVGGGKRMFPPLDKMSSLQLVETQRFGGGVVLLRYQTSNANP